MTIIKRYFIRYAWDVFVFLRAYALACAALLPTIIVTTGIYAPVVYMILALVGLVAIVFTAGLTAILDHYGYKFLIFVGAVAIPAHVLSDTAWAEASPGAVNVTLLIFVQLLFLFAFAYVFLEREGIRRQLRTWPEKLEAEVAPKATVATPPPSRVGG